MFTIVSPGLNPVRIGSAPSSPSVDAMDVQVMGEFFRGLWKDFNILNSVVVTLRCTKDEEEAEAEISDLDVGYYNPFEYVGGFEGQDELNWGQFHWTTQSGLREKDRDFMTKRYVPDFRGYPIKVNQFRRYPTAIDPKYIPIAVQKSHIYKQCLPTGKSSTTTVCRVNIIMQSSSNPLLSTCIHRLVRPRRSNTTESRVKSQL